MTEIYELWASSVFWIVALCVFLSVLTIPFYKWKKRGIVVIVFFCIAAFSFLSLLVLEHLLKNKITNEVSELISEDSYVVETYEDFDNELFLKALKSKQFVYTHRTRPLEKSSIHIVNHQGEVKLQVAQDSKYPHLYWVYYPKYRYSSVNELGKVRVNKVE
ncbi:hypothetical protein [Vibrio parahaemolyticus]|uniref:hypothetical protein n=1 Tax=Vibrio parahaemolyticus TaxID=670 RepID=UPI001EEAA678|nr:hypothetical protein [Vibrio parahaemolyticus]MCG6480865.1 hypothetical protein [Vibrio parahaemolyticus]HCG6765693.1 hypothetical protein [Vibrio parahaemolyticus]